MATSRSSSRRKKKKKVMRQIEQSPNVFSPPPPTRLLQLSHVASVSLLFHADMFGGFVNLIHPL